MNKQPILIVGLPRSGTTWQYNTLTKAAGTFGVFEPDNCNINPFALYFFQGCHRFPEFPIINKKNLEFWKQIFKGGWNRGIFREFVKIKYLRNYQSLEAEIQLNCNCIIPENKLIRFLPDIKSEKEKVRFNGLKYLNRILAVKNPSGIVIIKSVHCIRQLESIQEEFDPRIILVTRNILNLVASYLRLKLPDSYRGIGPSNHYVKEVLNYKKRLVDESEKVFLDIITQACELTRRILDFSQKYPNSLVLKHETVCQNPKNHFQNLFKSLNLEWTEKIEDYINSVDKEGIGFQAVRKIEREQERYKDQLTGGQIRMINDFANIYELQDWV